MLNTGNSNRLSVLCFYHVTYLHVGVFYHLPGLRELSVPESGPIQVPIAPSSTFDISNRLTNIRKIRLELKLRSLSSPQHPLPFVIGVLSELPYPGTLEKLVLLCTLYADYSPESDPLWRELDTLLSGSSSNRFTNLKGVVIEIIGNRTPEEYEILETATIQLLTKVHSQGILTICTFDPEKQRFPPKNGVPTRYYHE
ncbi:hypothetical protein BDN72DRAFT_966352 [Pluteus cervinus]|uniref:Uncharacterized protein n=1 Tax=Pluteus cervinus TaxID=181527 RepID=A0ACD2ZXY1_9AGAR|nr:hypothetical protein BDN72DRAFT_966352 [Pluteus cervinus]